MPLLDPDELADMREAQAETLSQQAVINRCTIGKNGSQEVKTFTPDAEPIACRVAMFRAPREVLLANEIRAFVDGEIKLPWEITLEKIDQIVVDSAVYDVVGHDAGRADATLLTVQVVRAG